MLQASAEPLDGPRVTELKRLAKDLNIWLVPGSVCEHGPEGQLFNTQLVLSPDGELAGYYRKIFPWRPFEPYDPGDKFTTVDLPGIGKVGLNICYDAWYPEVSRQLAWMGAEVVINVVKTTTPDRKQELILARANAIVNQVFMVSVNCAGPTGKGQSIIVGPEGNTLAEAPDDQPQLLTSELDLAAVEPVRTHGTETSTAPGRSSARGSPPSNFPSTKAGSTRPPGHRRPTSPKEPPWQQPSPPR
ncbi:putative amidohydrolase [Pseudarthrobacter siccitolerans]|uniref:Amidohydrolase n=2 Tax=Pseudarthrobacter siccitolerans TaxID=861266 RepID=A0ABU0PQ67_9MICC|nr:putative amidohydrolase [Pseudarthrobacter siccitolerans]